MKRFGLYITFFLGAILLLPERPYAQTNLVVNGSFEEYAQCPKYGTLSGLGFRRDILNVKGWSNLVRGYSLFPGNYLNSCDTTVVTDPYFNTTYKSYYGVPQNYVGYEPARSGKGYAVFFCESDYTTYRWQGTGPYSEDYIREFITGTLADPLVAGKTYYFEMFVSLAERSFGYGGSNATMGEIGVYFSDSLLTATYVPSSNPSSVLSSGSYHLPYPLDIVHTPPVIQSSGWFKISGNYTARGTEKYLMIGSAEPHLINPPRPSMKEVFYYVDDVSLRDCDSTQPKGFLGPDTLLCGFEPFKLSAWQKDSIVEYTWQDGSKQDHLYASSTGIYWAEVSIRGCPPSRDSIYMQRIFMPQVNLGPDSITCLKKPMRLESIPSYPPSFEYTWSTQDTIPSILIEQPGTYWLEIENQGCKARDSIAIYQFPLKEFSLGPDTGLCIHTPYLLDATSTGATGYKWSTSDTTASIYALQSGLYWGEAYNLSCVFRDSVRVGFKNAPAPLLGNDTTVCDHVPFLLDAQNEGATYSWNKGGTGQVYEVTAPGFYSVQITRDGCQVSDSLFIYMDPAPPLELGQDTTLCGGISLWLDVTFTGATYLWKTPAGSSSTLPRLLAQQDGQYKVSLRKGACLLEDSITLSFVAKPDFSLGNDTGSCFEQPLVFDLSAVIADSYRWNDGSSAPSYTAASAGLYWVEIARSSCAFRDSVFLTQYSLPVLELGSDTFICEGSSFTLDAGTGFAAYSWNTGSTQHSIQTTIPGIYRVTVRNNDGCTATDSLALDLKPLPIPVLPAKIEACNPDLVLDPGTFAAYLWQLPAGQAASPDYRVNDYGLYSVEVTDDNGCRNSTLTEVVDHCPAAIYVPNAFTPNSDGLNEVFIPLYVNIRSVLLQVYDRWGQLVFETHELDKGWDGRFREQFVTTDVYTYRISYTGNNRESSVLSGNVTLLR